MTNPMSPSMIAEPFADDLAVALEPTDAGVAVALPFEERNTMHGLIHGGALASLVPISTFAAVRARDPAARDQCTVSLHMEYVRAARKPVVAHTRSVRRVRELEFFETRVTDREGNAIAVASSTVSVGVSGVAEAPGRRTAQGGEGGKGGKGGKDPLDRGSPDVAGAIQEAIAASPYLSRRCVSLAGSARGVVELALAAAPVNLGRNGSIHEGAVMTLIDAAGATCPWTVATARSGGATIALHVQILGPLPAADLIARASVRARGPRIHWLDVSVVSSATQDLHALGTVVYRFNETSVT